MGESNSCSKKYLISKAMDPFNGGEISQDQKCKQTKEILDWVRRDGETALHPSCSAKMGPTSRSNGSS